MLKNKTTFFLIFALMFLVVAVPMVSAAWYDYLNPINYFKGNELVKSPKWIEVYSDNSDFYPVISDPTKQDSEIYLCSKTARKKKDLKDLDFATSFKTEAKDLKSKDKLKPIEYDGKFCYYYKPQKDEKFLKFDKHSTHFSYTEENLVLEDNFNNIISEMQLTTDDYRIFESKPNKKVGAGEGKILHTFSIQGYANSEEIINNLNSVDMRTGKIIERNLKFQRFVNYYNVSEERFTTACEYDYHNCVNTFSHYENVTYENWTEVEPLDILEGDNVRLRVIGDVEIGDYYDIVFLYGGVDVSEYWATISEDLSDDLIWGLEMNEEDTTGSGTILDVLDSNDATNNGASNTSSVSSNLVYAYDFESSDSDYIGGSANSDFRLCNFTISFWMKRESITSGAFFSMGQDGATNILQIGEGTAGTLRFHIDAITGGYSYLDTSVIPTGSWHHIVAVWNGTKQTLYVDGSLNNSGGSAVISGCYDYRSTDFPRIGRDVGSVYVDGVIDQPMIWNRTLSSSEISTLYNSGDGIPYGTGKTTPTLNLSIDKTSPQTYGSTINVSCTTDSNGTLTGYINDSAITLNTNILLGAGYYEIKCNVTENDYWASKENETTFTIDKATPTGTITGTSPIGFGTAANVEGTESNTGDSDVNYTLYRNGTYVSNPDTNDSLPVGVYGYVYNTTGGANYSANSSMDTFILEVSEIPVADVTLYSPANGLSVVYAPAYVEFTCGVDVDGSDVVNVSLLINGVVNQTNSSGFGNVNYTFDEDFNDGNYTWSCRAYNNFSLPTTAVSRYFNVNTTPYIEFIGSTPANDSEVTSETLSIEVNISQPFDYFLNWTAYLYNSTSLVSNQTYTNSTRTHTFTYPREGAYTYYAETYTNTSQYNRTETRYISTDFEAPSVEITAPADGFVVTEFNQTIDLNWSISDSNLESCWYNYPSGYSFENGNDGWALQGNATINQEWSSVGNKSVYVGYYDGTGSSVRKEINFSEYSYITFDFLKGPSLSPYVTSTGCIGITTLNENRTYNLSLNSCTGLNNISFYATITFPGPPPEGVQGYIDNIKLWRSDGSVAYLNHTLNCSQNYTINYPVENPDNVSILLYANDTFGNTNYDNVTIYKNTTAPQITITSPVSNYNVLNNGEVVDLNFTISGNVTTLDECWYEYNNTNTTISCTENTNFTYIAGNNSLRVWVNDTLSNINSSLVRWYPIYTEYEIRFNPTTVTGFTELFYFTARINYTSDISSVQFNYDSNYYTPAINDLGGGLYNITNTEIIAASGGNSSFKWEILFLNGAEINSSTNNQSVTGVDIDNCSNYSNLIMNLNLFDEVTLESLNGTIDAFFTIYPSTNTNVLINKTLSGENVSTLSLCSDLLVNTSSYRLSARIKYVSEGYAPELYFIQLAPLSSYPINLSLYDLNLSSSTEFLIRYQDDTLTTVEGAVIQLMREYISQGTQYTVEAPLTSNGGTAVVHIDLNSNIYSAIVVKDGVILDTFDNIVFDCENELSGICTQNLFGKVDPQNFVSNDIINDFSSSVSSTNNTVTLTYSMPSGTPANIRVVLEQKDIYGQSFVCNKTVVSSSGFIVCDYEDSLTDSILKLSVYKNGELLRSQGYRVTEAGALDWLGNNFFIVFILVISLVGMAMSSPEWMIINSVISLIFAGGVWLVSGLDFVIGLGTLAWLIIAAVIIIIKLSKQEDR